MALYHATIELLVTANSYAEACDAIAEPMRELIQEPRVQVLDWQYLSYRTGAGPKSISIKIAQQMFDEYDPERKEG